MHSIYIVILYPFLLLKRKYAPTPNLLHSFYKILTYLIIYYKSVICIININTMKQYGYLYFYNNVIKLFFI